MNFNSDKEFQFKAAPEYQSNQSDEVFFIVNVKELFNVDLTYPGIIGALNSAFMDAKSVTPIDTGLMRRSMTMIKLDEYRVKIFFDRDKIVGKMRKGVIVKDYYPIYLADHAKTFNWLTIVIKHFYDTLYAAMRNLKKKATEKTEEKKGIIDFTTFTLFYEDLKSEYKVKKQEAIELRKQEREKKKAKEQLIKEKKRKIRLKNDKVEEVE